MTRAEAAEMMGEVQLAPGVHGTLFDTPDGIYIPTISADEPGSGDVGRYLDSLPRNRTVKFPTVMSGRLREMLVRRGFVDGEEWSKEYDTLVEMLVRVGS